MREFLRRGRFFLPLHVVRVSRSSMVDLASMTDGPKERARNQGPASICGHPRLSSQEEGELQADMQYPTRPDLDLMRFHAVAGCDVTALSSSRTPTHALLCLSMSRVDGRVGKERLMLSLS